MNANEDPDYRGNPNSTAAIGGHPIHPMLVPFPITCFVGALVTDLLFLAYGDVGFATASKWLLGFGIGTALIAATAGLIDFMGDDRIRSLGTALKHMIANVTVVVIEVINLVVRLSGDQNVLTLGIYLSAAAAVILIYSGWLGGHMVYHHRVGVQDRPHR